MGAPGLPFGADHLERRTGSGVGGYVVGPQPSSLGQRGASINGRDGGFKESVEVSEAQQQQQQPQPYEYSHNAWQQAVRDAARDGRISSPALLLMALWHHARADVQTGLTAPFVAELVDVIGVGSTKVKELRSELMAVGFLALEKKGIGQGNPSVYRLSLPVESRPFPAAVSSGSSTGIAGNSAAVSRDHLELRPTTSGTKTPIRRHVRTAPTARRLLVKVLTLRASA
jgi:hypothetical protein